MTVRLYDRDVDMLEFSAVVKTCEQREKGYIVTLDQTAFFPEGGGQGADHGPLTRCSTSPFASCASSTCTPPSVP